MESKLDRKAAARDFKLRAPERGIFALRCAPAGLTWVGATHHLDSEYKKLSFILRGGLHREAGLQAAWARHGEAGFAFESLEKLDPETTAMLLGDLLQQRKRHWAQKLGAKELL